MCNFTPNISELRHCDFWAGGERQKDELSQWHWTATRKTMPYSNWNHGEPNNGAGHEHCLQVSDRKDFLHYNATLIVMEDMGPKKLIFAIHLIYLNVE